MATSGIHNHNHNHFVQPTDLHQTNAVSSNFKPATLGNKAAAFFKQQKNPNIQKLGKTLENIRSGDLKARAVVNNFSAKAKTFVAVSSASIEASLRSKTNPDAAKQKLDAKIKNIELKAEIKSERINLKQNINKADSVEELKKRVDESNGKLQGFLMGKGFVAVDKHLSDHPLPKHDAEYLSNAQGHKVRINYERPSFFQKEISKAKSDLHDQRIKGASKQAANAALNGAVGLSNAIHLAKQGVYAGAAKLASKNSEERTTFQRKADKERDMRHLNNAALGGNSKLADTFDKLSNQRKESLEKKLSNQGYTEAKHAMPSTGYTTRKIDDYLSRETPNPKIAKAAEYFVEAKNLKESVKAGFHGGLAKIAGSVLNSTVGGKFTASRKEDVQGFINEHGRSRFDALFRKSTNSAALNGNLQQEVKNQEAKFKRSQSGPQPGSARPQSGGPQSAPRPESARPQSGGPQSAPRPESTRPQSGGPQSGPRPESARPQSEGPQSGPRPESKPMPKPAPTAGTTPQYSKPIAYTGAKLSMANDVSTGKLKEYGELLKNNGLDANKLGELRGDILALSKTLTADSSDAVREGFNNKYKNVFADKIDDNMGTFSKFALVGLKDYKADGQNSEFWTDIKK